MKNNILVFCEQQGNKIADVSLELITKGRELAGKLGCSVDAVILGHGLDSHREAVKDYGVETVYYADREELKDYQTLLFSEYLTKLIEEQEPQIALFGASIIGRDIAPRVASAMKCGLTADCTSLEIGDYYDPVKKEDYKNILFQIRPAFGGNIIATIVNPETRPQMATVREGVMKMETVEAAQAPKEVELKYKIDLGEKLFQIIEKQIQEKDVDLKSAHVIIAGGFGVGSKEGFDVLHDFAKLLKAEVGASRAAVDAGWIGHDHQIGQTGVTVRPKLYIACGISGSIQHRAGMQDANIIIAINKDPEAPIMSVAHYGIVGDMFDVIPKFTEAYKKHLK